jgi:hypothetical protein
MADRCEECGFEYDEAGAGQSGRNIVALVERLVPLLLDPSGDLVSRREPEVWSPLEYACHIRDVLLVQRERVLMARRVDRPTLEPMGREERVDHDGYREQDAADVARQVIDAGRLFAGVLARLGPADWDRCVVYNYPSPSERSLRWVAVHTVHEVRHHLQDITRQID